MSQEIADGIAFILIVVVVVCLVALVLGVLQIVGMWKVYKKAGYQGWESIVPFYNLYIMLQIANRPGWWLILFFVPVVQIVAQVMVNYDIALSFNKDWGMAFGLTFLPWIFFPMLGFDKSTYVKVPRPENIV